jgi:mRNA-degrading endonuclease RelE of RelBE toxin-antitoxin system
MEYPSIKIWTVKFSKRVIKELKKLPAEVRDNLVALVDDIEKSGPVRGDWWNYSKLSDGSHHCHLNYRYVAVWRVLDNQIRIVEITYAGSRKDAPY